MIINFYELNQIENNKLEFAVITTTFKVKLLLVRHRERDTWEIPGGHRGKNENINYTASRELVEETGAKKFDIIPVCNYSVTRDDKTRYGRLFSCKVFELGELPNSEIEEVKLFDDLPLKLTYPNIQPYLYREILTRMKINNTIL